MERWSSDVSLDAGLVSELVAAQFGALAGTPVRSFGSGWDHDLFSVGPEWIFRFPKRADRVPWLLREIEILSVAGSRLGSLVPRFELIGAPSGRFRYPFVGYRRLPGIGADQVPASGPAGLAALAADVGRLLTALHRIDPGLMPPAPAASDRGSWSAQVRADLAAAADAVRPLLRPDVRARAEPYLAGEVPEPPAAGPQRFLHNDLGPEHLLVDPLTGRLTGVIDFTDAMVGEAVHDFAGLIGIGGYDFIRRVTDCYDLALAESFWAKLEWLCRTLTLTWLAEAAAGDAAAIPMHQSWVVLAFDAPFSADSG
ncbi:MAG TPA: aminoglycoside phosphotransferase family protein [Streptosporangiaceae bacterium]|nr:aminoglycoside phosphotransferase family protein [Streptosporangiaceae bacterium]